MKFSWLCVVLCSMLVMSEAAPIEKIMVDMSYVYDEHTQTGPNADKFKMTVVRNSTFGESDAWVLSEEIQTRVHTGTHMDAPNHFVPGGLSVDRIPISHFIAPAAVINIEERAQEDSDTEVLVEDLEQWESTTGQSLNGTVVLMNSGWGKWWHNRTAFIGNSEEDVLKMKFPGFGSEAAQWLVANRNIYGVGVDTLSFDKGSSKDYLGHRAILGAGLFGLESVANIDKIPIYGAMLHIMPMKLGQGSGAPTRVIATFPKIMFDH